MSKKLMLLVMGALSALAFAALPTVASAELTQIHCSAVAPAECIASIEGKATEHPIRLETDAGEKIEAESVKGSLSVAAGTQTTSTSNGELIFKNVREKVSGFNFQCNSPGAAAGEIVIKGITTHFVNLTHGGTTPGVHLTLPTGAGSVTFTCAGGLVEKTVTGSVLGHVTEANCNTPTKSNKVTFDIATGAGVPLGTQKFEQVTTTGTFYDLTSGDHNPTPTNDTTTSAQTGHGNITWSNNVTLTC